MRLRLAPLLAVGFMPVAARAMPADHFARIFHDFCLSSEPALGPLEAKATAMNGAKQVDKTVPLGPNRSLHQESWLVRQDDNVLQLTAMEGDAAAGPYRAVGCGLAGGGVDGAEVARTLATETGLGAPSRRVDTDGKTGNSVVWEKAFGATKGRVLLSWGMPGTNGVSIHLILPNVPK